jgi:hypothetical protein
VGVGAAARLQRALSTKGLSSNSSSTAVNSTNWKPSARNFIIEASVQLTTGVQSQERHLFLFNDLLLVAKPRSGGNFKLKERVSTNEMWLSASSEAVDVVTELTRSKGTAFVMGWPTTNVVATFK